MVYLGHMVQGKTTKLSFKSCLTVENPEESWYIVKNTHAPLIDEETFNLAAKKAGSESAKANGISIIFFQE